MTRRRVLLAVALLMSVAAFVAIEVARDRVYGEPQPVASTVFIRSSRFLERASLSHASLLADVYWIRTIQYYGGTRRSKQENKRYDLLYPLLDIVTTLDPRFRIAYRFGSVFLAEPLPGGAGRPDLAVELLEKGVRADPRWEYELDKGFVYYWSLQDFRKAAECFKRGSEMKGGPSWMGALAAVTLVHGGDRQGSRLLWQHLADASQNEWIRNNARLRLMQLDALDQIDQLRRIVAAAQQQSGVRPTSWAALVRGGWLRGIPVDPTGVPFVVDPFTGAIDVSPYSKLYPLPTDVNTRLRGPLS